MKVLLQKFKSWEILYLSGLFHAVQHLQDSLVQPSSWSRPLPLGANAWRNIVAGPFFEHKPPVSLPDAGVPLVTHELQGDDPPVGTVRLQH